MQEVALEARADRGDIGGEEALSGEAVSARLLRGWALLSGEQRRGGDPDRAVEGAREVGRQRRA